MYQLLLVTKAKSNEPGSDNTASRVRRLDFNKTYVNYKSNACLNIIAVLCLFFAEKPL